MSFAKLHDAAYAKLSDPLCPRIAVVRTPVGSGIRRVVERLIREIAAAAPVLVLTDRSEMARQWRDRLSGQAGPAVTYLGSAEAALGLVESDRSQGSVGQILISTTGGALRGTIARALAEIEFGLIVYDEIPDLELGRLERFNNRARRVISMATPRPVPPGWPVVVDMKLPDIEAALGRPVFQPISYFRTDTETALAQDVARLLQDVSDAFPAAQDRTAPRGLADLHAALLDVATELRTALSDHEELGSGESLIRRTWTLVGRVEDASALDSQLGALDEALETAVTGRSRCLVMAIKPSDVSYIASHLAAVGQSPVPTLTGAADMAARRDAVDALAPGEILIGSAVLAKEFGRVTMPYTVIMWSRAELLYAADLLGAGDGVRVLVLNEQTNSG